jgi:hypothetical protein
VLLTPSRVDRQMIDTNPHCQRKLARCLRFSLSWYGRPDVLTRFARMADLRFRIRTRCKMLVTAMVASTSKRRYGDALAKCIA